jgi:hypothetical protein
MISTPSRPPATFRRQPQGSRSNLLHAATRDLAALVLRDSARSTSDHRSSTASGVGRVCRKQTICGGREVERAIAL